MQAWQLQIGLKKHYAMLYRPVQAPISKTSAQGLAAHEPKHFLSSPCPFRVELQGERVETVFIQRFAHLAHQVQVVMQVVDGI